ncbi:MAG: hypothetical protein AAGL29_14920 [Bacteroidota bacterium]
MNRKFWILLFVCTLFSCVGGKFNYSFDTGRQLDFSQGKWIFNKTESNSKVFDSELNVLAYNEFRKLLGDSLMDLNALRAKKMIPPKIEFELSKEALQQLGKDTDCQYLINTRGYIVGNGAGSVSFDTGNGYYSASNQSSVSIAIYDLVSGTLLSASQAVGKATAENSHFDDNRGIPAINSSAETLMLKAAKNLIGKYEKYRLDK